MADAGLVVDTFAGPGGWDTALRLLGLHDDLVGVELGDAQCATRRAAGHPTIQGDVAALDPLEVTEGRTVWGYIGSPPCPTFSRLGKKGGLSEMDVLRRAAYEMAKDPGHVPGEYSDPRTPLVLQPIRWVAALLPEWVVLEQVPMVLPLWQTLDVVLGTWGYTAWCGKVKADDFDTPQVRERAVFIARRSDRAPGPPRKSRHRPPTMAATLGWTAEDPWWLERRNDQTTAVAEGEVNPLWPLSRPATTIAGRGLVTDPGSNANRFNGRTKSRNDGYRVEPAEAGLLQSFPPDYPWQGNQGEVFQQIGDAVPPMMGAHLIAHAAGLPAPDRAPWLPQP